jgi:hypothetical protein
MANRHIALIVGVSKGGKSTSLHGLKNPEGVMFLNCEADKEIPFPNCKFQTFTITDPYQVHEAFQFLNTKQEDPAKEAKRASVHTVIIDTATMLMEMFFSKYIHTANDKNKFAAWANYAEFFKELMQNYVANSSVNVIFLAHVEKKINEDAMVMETKVPVQGQLAKKGIEAYFTTIVAAKRVAVNNLETYKNNMLTINPEEEAQGVKHVFQTKITKDTVDEKLSSSMGMWDMKETFIDNNAQFLLDRLHEYYGTGAIAA